MGRGPLTAQSCNRYKNSQQRNKEPTPTSSIIYGWSFKDKKRSSGYFLFILKLQFTYLVLHAYTYIKIYKIVLIRMKRCIHREKLLREYCKVYVDHKKASLHASIYSTPALLPFFFSYHFL